MIIILEGPEGAGKSTLAKQLSKQTGFEIVHRSKPKDEEEKKQMLQHYIDAIKQNKNMIWDRCWYSEMVYGPIMRDAAFITTQQMYELETLLAKTGALIIYCTDVPHLLWKRATERGEDYITDFGTLQAICTAYDAVMFNIPHIVPVVTYKISEKAL